MSVNTGDILLGLDIGSSKTCAIIGEVTPEGLNVIGAGSSPSKGIQKGAVINIESAAQSIQHAIDMASVMAGCTISSVIVDITGNHIQGLNSNGVAHVKGEEVSAIDIANVLETAKAVAIPPDREFLHILPQEYMLDGQGGIRNPRGMSGVRLEAKVHIVTGASSCVQNIIKCVNRCNVDVADIVLASLAASEAVISDDEKELGCVLIDIGSGTTDLAIWSKGALMHTHVLSIGGNHLTSDIAKGLPTSLTDAEALKIHSGCALTSAVGVDEVIYVPGPEGREPRKLPRQVLADIIEPRLEEIFEMVNREIEKSGFKDAVSSGIILTGGCAIMDGVPELAERVIGLPARRGVPRGIGGMTDFVQNPQYSTAIGLLLHVMNHPDISSYSPQDAKKSSLWGKFVDWIKKIV
ncbi:MAG: cell division protein FtsA [Proteobacteria bacterium]|nr:cell division protein FtsA [Pseudomonadota bacterium]